MEDLPLILQTLHKNYDTEIVAADPKARKSIYTAELDKNLCVVFGNEDSGISEPILKICNSRIAIPMNNRTDSINVASASAVFLNEVIRQRKLS
jgi:tRNA G18 (ribose-2'-O)-methylase SpoU